MKLFTTRLKLRNFDLQDTEAYLEMTARADYQRFYPPSQCSEGFGRKLVGEFIQEAKGWPRARFHMAIEHSLDERFAGIASVRVEEPGVASVGFGVHPDYWGQGIAVEALLPLMDFVARECQIKQFVAHTLDKNEAAKGVLGRLGFALTQFTQDQFYFRDQRWHGVTFTHPR